MSFEDQIRQTFALLRALAELHPDADLPAAIERAGDLLIQDWYAEEERQHGIPIGCFGRQAPKEP